MSHLLHEYWGWVGGNIGAMPLELLLGAVAGFLFRNWAGRHLAAWWHRHHGEHLRAELAALEHRVTGQLDAQHEALKAHINASREHGERI